MTETADASNGDYTKEAHAAILAAVRDERDFGGWLAGVLASVSLRPRLDRRTHRRPSRIVGSRRWSGNSSKAPWAGTTTTWRTTRRLCHDCSPSPRSRRRRRRRQIGGPRNVCRPWPREPGVDRRRAIFARRADDCPAGRGPPANANLDCGDLCATWPAAECEGQSTPAVYSLAA